MEGGAGGAHGFGEVAGQVSEDGCEEAVGDAEVEGVVTEGLGPYRKVEESVLGFGNGESYDCLFGGGDMDCETAERLSGGDHSAMRRGVCLQANERNSWLCLSLDWANVLI